MVSRALTVCALVAGLGLTACNDDDESVAQPTQQNIVQLAQGNANLSTLVAAVQKADLVTTLSGTTQLTVFAPTNDAFSQLPAPFNNAQNITAITNTADIATLRNILLYHVTAGDVKAADLRAQAYTTQAAAPNNNIYVSKPAAGGVFINGNTRVTTADVDASNGVVHVIDRVLMPPSQSIAQIVTARASASTNPEFTLLLQALQRPAAAPILTAAASQTGNVTVFAPTDAAFRALLGNAQLSSVSDADLTAILSRHVIGTGRVFSTDLAPGTVATLGGNVTIAAAGTGFTVRGASGTAANITAANILATNGVVHVIDQVIRPN
ncbi:hypothetical protein GCM10023186_27520 [Hymenobacter koreensis]|uniref:FAS1 domain-containing protein n=2 Tax=Hymenobacter koreensis TaxID=1084523 RepID=A0ABP8J496_9BACT